MIGNSLSPSSLAWPCPALRQTKLHISIPFLWSPDSIHSPFNDISQNMRRISRLLCEIRLIGRILSLCQSLLCLISNSSFFPPYYSSSIEIWNEKSKTKRSIQRKEQSTYKLRRVSCSRGIWISSIRICSCFLHSCTSSSRNIINFDIHNSRYKTDISINVGRKEKMNILNGITSALAIGARVVWHFDFVLRWLIWWKVWIVSWSVWSQYQGDLIEMSSKAFHNDLRKVDDIKSISARDWHLMKKNILGSISFRCRYLFEFMTFKAWNNREMSS